MSPLSPIEERDESPAAALDGLSRMEQSDAPSLGADVDSSPRAARDASPLPSADVAAVPERRCLWCRSSLEVTALRWCSKKCRQTAWRARRLAVVEDLGDTPKRLAYADPPYPGLSRKYYRDEPTYAGEVDHAALIERLKAYDGWALSTSARALRDLLPLCPPEARTCPWVKPNGVSSKSRGAHNTWEALIVVPARERQPGFRDWLSAKPARGGGTLPGRKPLAFCAFLFQQLGASPGDELDDLFPGSGVVGRAFAEFKRPASPSTRGDAPSLKDNPVRSSNGRRVARVLASRPEQLSTPDFTEPAPAGSS